MENPYLTHFGLKETAFNITPDPGFLYLSKSHREGLAQLSYGVNARKGFIVLTGEVGTGKTTLIQALIRELHASTRTALIFNTIITPLDLLRFVCEEFALVDPRNPSHEMHDYLTLINEFLLDRYRAGGNCALIIDEAQNLSPEVLESIRLLSNFETPKDKLLQILLIGQPELATRLNSPALRQLKQRITLRHNLRPLSIDDCRNYIFARLRAAGAEATNVFGLEVLEAVHNYAGGIPRLINVLCDNAMLTAFALGKRQVEREIIREVAEDLNLAGTLQNVHPTTNMTTHVAKRFSPKPKPSAFVETVRRSEPPSNPQPVTNRAIYSESGNDSLPCNFFDELSGLLIDAMGPMALVVLRDRVTSLRESVDRFPKNKLGELIESVSEEILEPSMKHTFQQLVQQRVSALSPADQRGVSL
jgi:type II secretory pathway predicted ATPase ExeA